MYSLTIRNHNDDRIWKKKFPLAYRISIDCEILTAWHRHRGRDLPAVTYSNGEKQWWVRGVLHRDNDLPAVICANGEKKWAKKGIRYSIVTHENGTKEWRDNYGKFHNYHDPAIIYSNGDVEYWVRGKRHRINGPAVIIGKKQYFFEFGEFKKCIFCI